MARQPGDRAQAERSQGGPDAPAKVERGLPCHGEEGRPEVSRQHRRHAVELLAGVQAAEEIVQSALRVVLVEVRAG